jgi:protein SCO1/2
MHVLTRAARAVRAAMLLLPCVVAWAQPAPMRGLAFVDHHGRPLDAAALRGRPVLLHFVYTTCSTTCPLQVRELAALRESLPESARARLRLVSMTVDPLQDTPASLAAFAQRQGADAPGWHFATGRPAQVHALLDRMQALSAKDPRPENHRTSLYLYDARGELVQRYAGVPVDRPRLAAEINQVARAP